MPEMFNFCGQSFKVFKRSHKTCDPPNGIHGRRMASAVHLEGLRCNGNAHGGCQHGCLMFWKEAWLEKLNDLDLPVTVDKTRGDGRATAQPKCTEADVWASAAIHEDPSTSGEPTYVCQSTELARATQPLQWWDVSQYMEDCTSGNVRPSQVLGSLLFFLVDQLAKAGLGIGSAVRWVYDRVQQIRGGPLYPNRVGLLPKGAKTPSVQLNLQPGEMVRVRSYKEILETLTETGHHRGMWFGDEMVPYCGGTHRVISRVERIIDEKTGKILQLKNECIVLDGVICKARYSAFRKCCPRSIQPFWREIWLERVAK